jgi:DNA-binding transcriptional ArsR family regulator
MMVCATDRRAKARLGCGSLRQPTTDRPRSPAEVVRAYIRDYRVAAQRGRRDYALQHNLADTVRAAALSKLADGKRHPHQRRIPGRVLQQAATALANADFAVATFDDLHEAVRRTIGPLRGIGALAVYDVACRIGAHLGLAPDRVYLHAGTREGARALDRGGTVLSKSELPKAFYRLSPGEIEDCLCIYKDDLWRLAGRGRLRRHRRQGWTKRKSACT